MFLVIFSYVSKVVTVPEDYRNYQWVAGFYEEPEDTLDAVYIGSSNCYAFWNSLTAWEENGIAVWPYAAHGMMFEATEYIIKEGRKTQPDALYIVNLNGLTNPNRFPAKIHWTTDYMPFSLNKMQLINCLTKESGYSLSESIEYYIPLTLYHDRWSDLNEQDFNYEVDGLKGAGNYPGYINKTKDITDIYLRSDNRTSIDSVFDVVESLLDYCEEENVKVLFVTVPRVEKPVETIDLLNSVNDYIESRGFDTLNLMNKDDEIGLELNQDYYNNQHTNIHGSIKFTRYISQYIIDKYGFENKRGNETYNSWEDGLKKYNDIISPYALDIERGNTNRDYTLEKPASLKAEYENQGIVSWKEVDGADFYNVYRKYGIKGQWEKVETTKDTMYIDECCESGNTYYYTVVPSYEKDGTMYYGKFKYKGVSLTVD